MCVLCYGSRVEIVNSHLATIGDLPLGRDRHGSDYVTERTRAAAGIRAQVSQLTGELRTSQAATTAAETATSDTAFTGRVAQQVARLLDREIDFGSTGFISDREFSVTGDGVNATLSVYRPELSVGNQRAGLRAADLPLSEDGLTASAVLQLAGLFGVTPTRKNTPRALHDELFEDEPQAPTGLAVFLSGVPGALIEVELGSFAQR